MDANLPQNQPSSDAQGPRFVHLHVTGKDEYFLTNRASEDFIRSEINGKVYLLGNRAKISLLEATQRANAHQMDTFYTIGRFKTKEYEVAFQSFIAYALYQYQLYSVTVDKTPFTIEQLATSKIEIRVGSALPHARADEVWEESILPLLLEREIQFHPLDKINIFITKLLKNAPVKAGAFLMLPKAVYKSFRIRKRVFVCFF